MRLSAWGMSVAGATALLLAVMLVGCAKRPSATMAPSPGSGAPVPSVAASAPGTATMPSAKAETSGVPRAPSVASRTPGLAVAPGASPATPAPAPRDFTSIPELKDIHFDFDKYDIRPGEAKLLDDNAKWMKANENYLILIEGHADERGTNEYNLALGDRRAKAAMTYLIAQGVQASRVTVISYGEERPLCKEKNEECWAKNRRAHSPVRAK